MCSPKSEIGDEVIAEFEASHASPLTGSKGNNLLQFDPVNFT